MNVPKEGMPEDVSSENSADSKKTPIFSYQVPGSSGSMVEAAIWSNTIDLPDGEKGVALAVSFTRSYKKEGKWKKTNLR